MWAQIVLVSGESKGKVVYLTDFFVINKQAAINNIAACLKYLTRNHQ